MISGIHHINLTIPPSTFPHATAFYADTLGLHPRPVPHLQRNKLLWFDIGSSGQQVHIAIGAATDFSTPSSRHPCFRVGSAEELKALQDRVYRHFEKGGDGAPVQADAPGGENSGAKGVEYPTRFFAR